MLWRRGILPALVGLAILSAPLGAKSFELEPTGTDNEQVIIKLSKGFPGSFWSGISRRIIEHFSSNVHEEITNRIWGCDPPAGANIRDLTCTHSMHAPPAVIFGVQWNDNPSFKLDSTREDECEINRPIRLPDRQPNCWRILFGDASKRAARGEYFRQRNGMALLYRTHFGDLQFQHSMASWNGETMNDTRQRIMTWAQFTYLVSLGEIQPRTNLQQVLVPGFQSVLGRYWGDVTTLFTYGVDEFSQEVSDVAFGSFLHMVQDSFSASHVMREAPSGTCGADATAPNAGRILEFHAYGGQDSDKHAEQDTRDLMLAGLQDRPQGNVVAVGRYLKALREARAPWSVVEQYLISCIYAVAEEDLQNPAGPGPFH